MGTRSPGRIAAVLPMNRVHHSWKYTVLCLIKLSTTNTDNESNCGSVISFKTPTPNPGNTETDEKPVLPLRHVGNSG